MAGKALFLDRDGVGNGDGGDVHRIEDFRLVPGILNLCCQAKEKGYLVLVATNQSGVGRGLFDMDTLNAIHDKMHRAVRTAGGRIDAIFYCPHAADSNCECRKPKPGMFERIAGCFNVDLGNAYAVGDSLRDLQAAASTRPQPETRRCCSPGSRSTNAGWETPRIAVRVCACGSWTIAAPVSDCHQVSTTGACSRPMLR